MQCRSKVKSQIADIGLHWNIRTINIGTMSPTVRTMSAHIAMLIDRLLPESRSRKTRIEILTSANIGLYRTTAT